MNRRQLLAALGCAPALTLPAAFAAEASPKRLLVYLSAQGGAPWLWTCDPFGRGNTTWQEDWTSWSASDLSDSLRPLHPWRHQITAVGGIGMLSAVSEGKDQQHRLSAAHVLTGAKSVWYSGSAMGGGPSVDQIVADRITAPDQLRSVEASIFKGLGHPARKALYREALHALPASTTVEGVWSRLFGRRPASRIRTALELGRERFDVLGATVSSRDRQLLEQHRDLLSDVLLQAEGLEARTCDAPVLGDPPVSGVASELTALLPVLTTALRCDLTRVATIQSGEALPTELGVNSSIHGHAHAVYSSEESAQVMAAYLAYHAERFVQILDALDAVQDGDGTLLDNTLVLWMSELGDGAHGYDDCPVVVAGGRHSGVRLGRYLNFARTNPVQTGRDGDQRMMGMPHNRVLVTVCRAMGLDLDAVGMRSVQGWDGSTVSLTGAIPELLG
ncbi:MAG: DUF1552 domain-containing protein [Myxococcales bacterium]|nr:DUF1552 domain-containing protein [Myxococcales bacterium]